MKNMCLRLILFLIFSLIFAISATEYEYPTLINPDGTIQPREYSKEQRATFDSIRKETKYFQSEIEKIIPYLVRNGKVKNNVFTKEVRNYTEFAQGYGRNQHFVSETFVLNLTDGKLKSISFLRRRTRLNPNMEPETVIRSISNEVMNEEMSDVKLQIDKHTDYTEQKSPIRKVFSMTTIPSPIDRIKLIRLYRTKIEETLRELERIIDRKELNEKTQMLNSVNEVDID